MDDAGPRERFLRVMCNQLWAIEFVFVLNLAIVILIGFSFLLGPQSSGTFSISVLTVTLSTIVVLAAVFLSLQCKRYHFDGSDPSTETDE